MKKTIKYTALIMAIALMAMSFSGCVTYQNFHKAFFEPKTEETVEPLKIGVFEPLSGTDAEAAKEEIIGIELAAEMFSEINGRPVELVKVDNQSDAEIAKAAALQLVDEGVELVLGSYSNVLSMAGGEIFKEHNIPAITASSTNPILTSTNEYYSRACLIDAYQGDCAADYVLNYLGEVKAACLVMSGDDYAAALAARFKESMQAHTGDDYCVTIIEYPEGTTNFDQYFLMLDSAKVSAVFFPSTAAHGAEVLKAAASYELSPIKWIGCSYWEDLYNMNVKTEGETEGEDIIDYVRGAVYVCDYDPYANLTPMASEFRKAYSEKYGKDVKPSTRCALGFDAFLIAKNAFEQVAKSEGRVSLSNAVRLVNGIEAVTGMITIDSDGNAVKGVVIETITKSGPQAVYNAAP